MPARTLGGRYVLGDTIGIGGMAEVFLATDIRLGRHVAVKVLRADLARDPTFHQRFRREAQSAASLNAPAIVSVYDTGEDTVDGTQKVPWIVMEHIEGRTLREVLQAEGRLLPQRALEVVAEVCLALEVAHRAGIVHRDVKPANVMLTRTGEVKVMDFGIARAAAGNSQTVTQTAAVIGTAAYLSPEQALGEQVDARSDVYSTGCLLYELVTGTPPFTGDSPVAVAYQHVREDPVPPSDRDPSLPPQLDAVVLKAMAKNPANRYQSAEAMREDLLRAAVGEPVEATPLLVEPAPLLPVADAPGPERRSPVLYALLGLLLLVVLVGLGLRVRTVVSGDKPVRTPDLVGLSLPDARAKLTDGGLRVGAVKTRFSDRPDGTVLEQQPSAGTTSARGSSIDLVTSQGLEPAVVPQVVGLSRAEAEAQLRQAKLVLGPVVPRAGNVQVDQVLEALPAPGTQLTVGASVTLVVSSGILDVPLVVGQQQGQAQVALQQAGFVVVVRFATDRGVVGRVLSQTPVNTTAPRGSTVTIVVSQAPRPTPTPTPSRTPSATPTPAPSVTTPPPSATAPATLPPSSAPPVTTPPSATVTVTPTPTR